MTVSLLIPWRYDPARDPLFRWTRARWDALLPDAELCVADSDGPVFNRAQARNHAFAKSTGDILVVADADAAINAGQIEAALEVAAAGEWLFPYDVYWNLNEHATDLLLDNPGGSLPAAASAKDLADPPAGFFDHRLTDSVGGCYVMPRGAWVAAGGYDERFDRWGYEDRAWESAVDVMWRPHLRLPGGLFHLWHPAPEEDCFGSPGIRDRQALAGRYRRARSRPVMARLIDEATSCR